MELDGKVSLVTGGAIRLGRVVAEELATAGSSVAITYRSSAEEAALAVDHIKGLGIDSIAVPMDLGNKESMAAAVRAVEDGLGPVDVLVNNASYFEPTPLLSEESDGWYRTFDVVLHGPYELARAVAPSMLERNQGCIINMVDLSAWHPWPDRGAHSVAKAALLALTRQLAVELAPSVRTNAIAPGPTIPAASFDSDQIDRLARRNLLGRWGEPADIARAAVFLASTNFVTGECITVDGGERWGHVRERFSEQ
ncbi:MAG: SDR family NAD(P)-dependent oxidoreductase [Acidimicrobiales bacterium]